MTIQSTLRRRVSSAAAAAALVVSSIVPVLLLGGSASAAGQVTNRSIRVTSSVASASSVTYNVSFDVASTTTVKGIVVEFCQNSPLIGAACTTTNGISSTPTTSTVNVDINGGSTVAFAVNASSTSTGRLILTDSTGFPTPTVGDTITFSFTATNPSDIGTYYARILTYDSEDGTASNGIGADDYVSAAPGSGVIDNGGVALSTARQLTINARVQEQLEFCVGAVPNTVVDNSTTPANCSATEFNGSTQTVDIGVVDSGAPSISPVPATAGGNDKNGAVMIRTNAVNGAVISYFAEQDTSSGKLKVPGAACSGVSTTDQCFNSAGTTLVDFSTAGEKFGMSIGAIYRPTGSTTTNLTEAANYNGDGTAVTGFAWEDGGANDPATTLASSSSVLDYEMLLLNFAARSAATTPTGSYSVTSTYIATATF